MKGRAVPSIISAETWIVGELRAKSEIQVDGSIKGDLYGRAISVGPKGYVEGTLHASSVRIAGTLYGRVEANDVVILASAQIVGNICHNTITVEEGAIIDGLRPWRPVRQPRELMGLSLTG